MTTKAKELDNTKDGDRNACPICNPNPKRVPMWKVWTWSRLHPGESAWKEEQ